MRIGTTLVIGGVLGFTIGISPGVRRMLDSSEEKKNEERERRWAEEERNNKQFDADYAFVCKKIAQRDIEIYTVAEKWDRELLADIERLALPTNDANKYRVKLEEQLKWRLNHHIEDCVRFQSRLREARGLFRNAAHRFRADIYQTKCDCECCERD